jgi:hypothetical protein
LLRDLAFQVRDTLGVPPLWLLVLVVLAVTAWVGAAAWAATIAEIRREEPGKHFLLGLLIPFVYPFLLLKRAPVRAAAVAAAAEEAPQVRGKALAVPKLGSSAERRAAAAGVGPAAQAPAVPAAPGATAAPTDVPSGEGARVAYDEAYFRHLKNESLVSAVAPCVVRYGGIEVEARIVLDVMPSVVTLEVRQAGGTVQRMRIPYAKIESVTLARQG